tara:strand:- start:183 stop:491 length:309 start_codon:yes stop_codon:yes gene_type:complete
LTINPHSRKAFEDNKSQKKEIQTRTMRAIIDSGFSGINAIELSKILKLNKNKSCGSALSRVKKKHPDLVVYKSRIETGESHGRYYFLPFAERWTKTAEKVVE